MLGANCEHSCCSNGDVYRGGEFVDGAFHPNFPKATLAQSMRRGYGRSSLDTPANNVFRDSVGYFIHAADGFAVDSDGVAYWSREVVGLDICRAFRPPNEDNAFSSPSNYEYSINPGPSHYVPCPFLAFDRWQAVYARFGLTQSGRIVAWDSANELLRHEGVRDPQFWSHELEPGPLESIETDMGLLKNFIVEKPPLVIEPTAPDDYEVARASFDFVLSGWVQQIDLTSSGSGYDSVPAVRLEGGGGTGATAKAVVNGSGQVSHILVTSSGSGYSSPPSVIIDTPAEGQQATATAVNLSTIKKILITSPGLYKESPRFVARRASDDRAIAILMASSQAVQESDLGADYFIFKATKAATAIAPRTDIVATVRRQVTDYISGAASSGTFFSRGSEDSSFQNYTDSFARFRSPLADNIGTSVISPHYLYDQSVSGASRETEIIPRGRCTRGYTYRGLSNIVGFVVSSTMPTLKATYWSGHGNNTNLPQPSFIPVPPGGDIFTDWQREANRLESVFYRDLPVIGATGRIGSVSSQSGTSNLWCVTLDTSGLEGLLEHYVDAHIVFENHFSAESYYELTGYRSYSKVNCLRVIFFCSPQWKEEPGAYRLVWEDNPTKPTNVAELSYEIDSSGTVNTDVSQSGYLFHDLGQDNRLCTNQSLPSYLPGRWKEVHNVARNDFQAVSINGDVYKFWPYPISRVSQTVDWAACDGITFEDYALGTDANLGIGYYGVLGDNDIQMEQRRTTTTRTLYHLLSRSPSHIYRHPFQTDPNFAEEVLFDGFWYSRYSDPSKGPSPQTYGQHSLLYGDGENQTGVSQDGYVPVSSVSVIKSRPFPRNGFIPGVDTHFVGGRSLRLLAPYDPRNPGTQDWYIPESQQQRLFFEAPMKAVSSMGDAESSVGRHIIESGTGRLFSLAFYSHHIASRQQFYEYLRDPNAFTYETIAYPGSGLGRISDVRGLPNSTRSLQSRVLGVPFSGQVYGSVYNEVSYNRTISTINSQFQDRLNNEENARFLAILPTTATATYYHPVNYVNIPSVVSIHDGAIGPIHVADNVSNLVKNTSSRSPRGIVTSSGWLLDSSSLAYPWINPLAPIFSYRGLLGAVAGKNALLIPSSAGSKYSAMLHADITEGYAGNGYTQPARPAIGNEYSNPSTPTGDYPYDSCLREKYTVTGPGGFVAGCSVVKPGSKFRSPPSVTISGGGGGGGASAVAHTQGAIESFGVVNSGSGYTHPPELVFSGNGIHPDPESIAITLNESGGVDSVTFNQSSAGGTEYFPSDLAIDDINTQTSPGFLGSYSPSHPYPRGLYQNPPTVSVSPSPVLDSISVTSGGQHYQSPPRVIINSETGKGADAVANISGPVSLITVTSEGSGYAYPPLVRCYLQTSSPDADFVDAVPSTDSFAASLVDGRVVSVAITGDGGSLHAPPQVEFINLLGVASVEIQNGGEGYDPENPPAVSLDEAASAEDAVLTPVIEDGVLVSVTVELSGGGYSGDNPSVTIDPPPSGGVQATAEAFFSPTPGSGASATSRINGSVYSCPVLQSGYGYRDAEVLFIDGSGGFAGGSRATGVANFATGSGSGAEISCLIDGRLLYIEMTSGGSGYSSSPEVLLSPENGAECQSKILYRSGDYSASKTQSEYWGGLLRDDHPNYIWDTSDETGYRCLGNFLTPIKWLTPDGTEVFDEGKGNFNGYQYAIPTIKHTTSESNPIPPGFYMHDPPRVESNSIGTYVFPATSLEESGFVFCKEIFGSEWFFGQSFISQPTEQESSGLYKTNIATLFEYGDARLVFEVSHLPSNLELSFNPGEVNLSLATTSGKRRNQPQFATSDSSYFPASQISWYFPSGSSLDVTTQDVEAAPALGAISGSSPTRSVSWSSSGGGKFRTTTTTQTLSLPAGSWLKKPSANITISQDGVVESVSLTSRGELFPGESLGEIVVQGTGSGCIITPKIARRVSAVTMNLFEGKTRHDGSFEEKGPESTPIGSTQDFIDGAKRTGAKYNTYAGTVGASVVFFGGGEIEPASAVVSDYGIEVTSPGLYTGTPEAYLVANGAHIPVSVLMGRESVIYDLALQSGGRGYSQDSVVYFKKSVAINKFYSHRSFEELSKRNTDYAFTGSGGTFKTDPCGLVWQQKSSFTPQFVIHKDWLSSQDDISEPTHKTRVNTFFENDWSTTQYYLYVASFGLEASLRAAVLTTYQNGFVTGCLVAHPGQSPGGTAAYNTPDHPLMDRFLYFSAYRSRTGPSSYLLYYVQKSRNGDWVTQTRFPINFSPHSNTNFWNAGMGEGMIAFPGECSSRAAAKSKIFNWYATGRNHLVRK